MAAGRILAAREQLLRLAPEDTTDVAWVLTRTYDPNFLATIPVTDAVPNVNEATRWYQTWYAVAVKQGLGWEQRIARSYNRLNALTPAFFSRLSLVGRYM